MILGMEDKQRKGGLNEGGETRGLFQSLRPNDKAFILHFEFDGIICINFKLSFSFCFNDSSTPQVLALFEMI